MNEKTTTISHNPFGRYSIVRRTVKRTECGWCGQPGRFQYGSERDDRARAEIAPLTFCSIGCARAFYGEEALS